VKVLNLQCGSLHRFEGWFASEADFSDQMGRGLVSCPLCGDGRIEKLLSAPRLNLRGSRADSEPAPLPPSPAEHTSPAQEPPGVATRSGAELAQARLWQTLRAAWASSEDVGQRFADQARAMHRGDTPARNIRGQTSPEEALDLLQEGIDVMPLPDLPFLKETPH